MGKKRTKNKKAVNNMADKQALSLLIGQSLRRMNNKQTYAACSALYAREDVLVTFEINGVQKKSVKTLPKTAYENFRSSMPNPQRDCGSIVAMAMASRPEKIIWSVATGFNSH